MTAANQPSSSAAVAINFAGIMVGEFLLPDAWRQAAVWHDGLLTEPAPMDDQHVTSAQDVNDAGQIIGWSRTVDGGNHRPLLWEDGEATELRMLGSDFYAIPKGINNHGEIVGESGTSGFIWEPHAVLWMDGRASALSPLADPTDAWDSKTCMAEDINDGGLVVGSSGGYTTDFQDYHAVLWDRGQVIDLGALPGHVLSDASAINNIGLAVGGSGHEGGDHHAVCWRDGAISALAEPPDASRSWAMDVNDAGLIVGHASAADPWETARPVIWEDGGVNELPMLPHTVASVATAINEHGVIAGWCRTSDQGTRAVYWKDREIIDLGGIPLSR